jgi:hypothetical protein
MKIHYDDGHTVGQLLGLRGLLKPAFGPEMRLPNGAAA